MEYSVSLEQLKDFYSFCQPNIQFISDINRRHFRLLLPNQRFLKLKDKIHNVRELQNWLIKLKPLDVFYSTSTYLDPTSVTPRPKEDNQYWGPGNIILSNDVAFDLDRQPLSILNLERARKDAVKLLEFIKNKGYPLKYIAFSGSKGFHLVFDDIDKKIEPNYKIREKTIIQRRKILVKEVLNKNLKIDASVTVDTRRIIRLPGTINSKTGYCCQYLSEDELRTPVNEWIGNIMFLPDHRIIPKFKWKNISKRKFIKKKTKVVKEIRYGYTTYITSSVLGTKGRHAILLSFPIHLKKRIINDLKNAQKEYNLTDIYIFKLLRSYQVICLKTVQRNRYQKILDFTHSNSANQLRNYNRVSLRMGPLINQYMQEVEPPAEFVTVLECDDKTRDNNYVSKGHINFLKRNDFSPIKYKKIHGNGEFNIVDAEIVL